MSSLLRTRSKATFSRLRLESLEEREVLATTLDLNLGTIIPSTTSFLDVNGDLVDIQLRGSTGAVAITSNESVLVNGLLDPGEVITGISITGASATFSLTFTVNSTAGDGTVDLGDITANTIIRGIFAAGTEGASTNIQLGSFTGVGFSNGGGINVTNIVGNSAGVALQINGNLQQRAAIHVSNNLTGDVRVTGQLAGTINVGGNVLEDGDGSAWTLTGQVQKTATINVGGDFASDFEARGKFEGVVNIGGAATGNFVFQQEVSSKARLIADSWTNVDVNAALNGAITARTGAMDLFVRGNLGGSVNTAGPLNLLVNGSASSSARIHASDDVTATVNGDFSGRLTGDGLVDLTVGRSIIGGRINADVNVDLTTGGSLLAKANVQSGGSITATINGGIVDSLLDATNGSLSLDVRTPVTNSTLRASAGLTGTLRAGLNGSTVQAGNGVLDLDIIGNVGSSRITSQVAVMLDVTGNLNGMTITSFSDDVTLSATGSLTGARIAANNASLDVNGSVNSTRVDAVASITADIDGSLSDSHLASVTGATVDLDIAGDLARTHISAAEVDLTVGRNVLDSSVTASGDIAASVTGNVTNSKVISVLGGVVLNVNGAFNGSTLDVAADATLDINGGMNNSRLYIDGDTGTTIDILGNTTGSTIDAGDATLVAALRGDVQRTRIFADGDITLGIDRSLSDSRVTGGGAVTVTLGGGVAHTDISANGAVAVNTIGGLNDVDVSTTGAFSFGLGGNILNSSIEADAGVSGNVVGNITTSSFMAADGNATLTVGGSYVSGNVQAAGDVIVTTGLDLGATIDANQLDVRVGRDLTASATLNADNVLDLNADNIGLSVARDFNGELNVSGSLSTGLTGSTATVVGRDVGANAELNINDIDETLSADELVFGGFFRGEFNLNSDLDTDLTIAHDLVQASINGAVHSDITVGGKLTSFTSASLFDSTGVSSGDFVDANGTVTGSLTAGSIVDIDPLS